MIGYNILPIGFSNYEKSTIETFFRLAGRRAPHWGLTTRSSEARVIMFNATSQQDVDAFRSLVASWQKVIIVGASDFGTGWPVLPRPIKLTSILGMLDAAAKEFEPKAADATASSKANTAVATPAIVSMAAVAAVTTIASKPNMTDVFANLTAKVDTPAPEAIQAVEVAPKRASQTAVNASLNEAPSFAAAHNINNTGSPEALTPINTAKKPTLGQVLIVDDSDIALKYMQNRLRHFGYESELARSGDEALAMVSKQSFQFVFLDVMMQGLDGYQTCRAIKSNKARVGPAPTVVMLTSKGGTIDKIRGTMAGCDAYMTKPLNEKQLTSVLAKFDDSTISERYEATNPRSPLVNYLNNQVR
jgi:two-component system, cell cycle response regulator